MSDTAKNILPIEQAEDLNTADIDVALGEKYSIDYVLTQIEAVQGQIEGIRNTINNIGCISDSNIDDDENESEVCEDVAMAKLSAMQAVFEKRENTLQSLLSFYFRLYDDLKNEIFKK